ncbi:MAG TPA: exodeoxyribonuclease VII large subunit, partial [Legionella sp.]|nr:exodeoxyribonuclease VII large subunit [Legionella sp.]
PARKKTLPRLPDCIGIITSSSGAALHDMLTTLARRFPLIPLRIYPSDVQGKQAPQQLICALQRANLEARCDVLILARGGGSMEDLWAFNDEHLAHAIANSRIPIVSGIGHETDFTIADFVADFRAATPTAAAETVTPDWLDFMARLDLIQTSLMTAMSRFIEHKRLLLTHQIQIIASPGRLIRTHWQTLDYLDRQLHRAMQHALAQKQHRFRLAMTRMQACHPGLLYQQAQWRVRRLETDLIQAMRVILTERRQRFITQLATLQAVSPLATLERGYALATFQHQVLTDSQRVTSGDVIDVRLARGRLMCEVI